MLRPLTKFPLINLKSLSLKISQKPRCSIFLKISKKSVNQPKNKRKSKSPLLKLTNSGNQENSISQDGVKEKTPFLLVFASKKSLKDSNKIK